MASIGSLTASLALESAAFKRDLSKASQAVASNSAKMNKSLRSIQTSTKGLNRQFGQLRAGVTALAGALVVRQFTSFARAAIETADSLAKQSKQLQFAAGELQRYRIEGELAGVTTEKLESGIGAFVKRVGELRAGTGTLVTILDKSNLALKQQLLAATSAEDGLKIMLEAIRNTGSSFDKLALAAAGFGRQAGQAMVLLAESAGTLDVEMAKLVTRSDSVLAASERLNDELTLLKAAFSAGFDTAIIEGLSGSVDASAESMREAREIGEEFGRAVGQAMRATAEAAKFVARNMRVIVTVLGSLVALKAAGVIISIATAMVVLAKAMVSAALAGNFLKLGLVGAKKGLIGIVAAVAAASAIWAAFGSEAVAAIEDAQTAVEKLTDGSGGVSALTDEIEKSIEANKEQIEIYKGVAFALEVGSIKHTQVADAIALENEVSRLGIDLTTEQGAEWLRTAREAQKYEKRLESLVDVQEQNAAAAKEVLQATAEQEREIREAMQRPFLNAIEGIQSAFTGAFESLFSGGVRTFSDLASTVKGVFVRLAAEIAALLVFRPALGGLLTGFGATGLASSLGVGGGGGGGSGLPSIPGIGNLFSGVGSTVNSFGFRSGLFGMPAMNTPMGFSPAAAGSLTSASLSSVLGVAGLGAFGGGILASLIGGNTTGGSVGGGLGAGLGFAVGGPIGGLIGGGLGSIAGSLFGGGRSVGPIGHTNIVSEGGKLVVSTSGADNGANVSATIQQAQQAVQALNALASQFDLAFKSNEPTNGILVGTIGQGANVSGPKSVEEFIQHVLKSGQISGSGSADTVLKNIDPTASIDKLTAGLQLAQAIDDIDLTDTELSIRNINKAWAEQIDLAKELGLATGKLVEQRDKEIQAVHNQIDIEKLNARAQFTQAASSIADFVRAQSLSATSSLSPTARLTEAQRQFSGLLNTVRGGDLGFTGDLTQSASTLLSVGRENFASSVDFANLEGFVRSSLLNLAETVGSDRFFEDARVEATRQQTAVLSGDLDEVRAAVENEVGSLRTEIRLLREALLAA